MTDLPVTAATGQPYGEAGAQQAAQQAVPMGSQRPLQPPPALRGPSARPGEPVQTGLPSGPGAGPEALPMPEVRQMTGATLRRLYMKYPSRVLQQMIERHDRGF